MKVAFFLGALNRGGAEMLLADVFGSGERLPFEAVCLYRKEGNLSDTFHATAVPMLHLPRKHSWILYGIRLRRLVRKQKVDIVHAQSAFNAAVAIISLAFTRVKVVTTLHGANFSSANTLYKWLVYRHSSRIVCVSEWERADYLRHGCCGAENRFVVVRNGVDFGKFNSPRSSDVENETVRLCMVGNFVPEKDQYFICQFLKELKSEGFSFDFYFVGRAKDVYKEYQDRCVSYCEQNSLSGCVHFLGGRDDVPDLLGKMDAFVYSSKSETFGIAIVEAIAMGLPTFVNDLDVFDEITQKGELAVLYRTGNMEDILAKFGDFMQHRQQYKDRAVESASRIRSLYSIASHIEGLHSLYLQIVSEK